MEDIGQIAYSRQEAEALVERWADMILRVAYTWTGNLPDAQDICQTALLKILTHAQDFPDSNRERAWVLRVTINCCKDLKKSAWARRRTSLDSLDKISEAAVSMPEPGESPVLEAVQSLPETYRQAIYLRYYEEYEVNEIAALMDCRASQVSTWIYRGKAKLKELLGGHDGQSAQYEQYKQEQDRRKCLPD